MNIDDLKSRLLSKKSQRIEAAINSKRERMAKLKHQLEQLEADVIKMQEELTEEYALVYRGVLNDQINEYGQSWMILSTSSFVPGTIVNFEIGPFHPLDRKVKVFVEGDRAFVWRIPLDCISSIELIKER